MAVAEIRPDWTVGTLTLVGGSKDFTTTGSALETAAIQAGDEIITASGNVLIIASITGQNSGTLMEVCPVAAAGADQPLRIRFQPDGSRYNGATADLIQRLSSGNLYAFSELQGVADGVPVFTGAGTMDVVPKSEFGPTDTHGNLAALAGLSKENNQFIVMGASGDIGKKPISDVTDAIDANTMAISEKFTLPSGGTSSQFINGTGALAAMNKSAVGLGNVDDTSDANKPVSTATQTALNTKSSYNWIINGDFTVNQRNGVKKPANGVYGFDRWKGHANGIEQIIENLPAGEYTLTWSGGGDGTFAGITRVSPIKATVSLGDAGVVVPASATKVSLVRGDATASDPWQSRSYNEELILCMRYYEKGSYSLIIVGWTSIITFQYPYKVIKRVAPTQTITVGYKPPGSVDPVISSTTIESFSYRQNTPNGGTIDHHFSWFADAEL